MSDAFSAKLALALKYAALSRSQVAAELGVDKSIVGRWLTGAVTPSAYNLSRLTTLVAARAPGFTGLDWERSLSSLAALLGLDPAAATGAAAPALPLALLDRVLADTKLRGSAYEGFFRSTRPYAAFPGQFIHDHGMIRRDPSGFLRLSMGTGGILVDGWILPLNGQLYCIGAELTSGSLVFGLFNSVATVRADVIDGLTLSPILDNGRTPTASTIIFERIADLSGDTETDDRRFADLIGADPVAPDESVSEALRDHLVRNIGPAQLPSAGDWLLQAPVWRSLSR